MIANGRKKVSMERKGGEGVLKRESEIGFVLAIRQNP